MNIRKLKSWLTLAQTKFSVRTTLLRGHAPILCHQMGKVGSTSLLGTLRTIPDVPPVCQTHFLSREGIEEAKETFRRWNSPIPSHLRFAEFIEPYLNSRLRGKAIWNVVSIVRDPVARQLSDIYQNPEVVGESADKYPAAERVLEYLMTYFRDFDESTDYVCRWFQREFIDLFNFQVYERNFPYQRPYEIFDGGNARGLVLRLEDFPQIVDNGVALGEWLGKPFSAKISSRNTAEERTSFESYKTVKANLKIPKTYLEKVYSTAFAKHFYADLREDLIARWSDA